MTKAQIINQQDAPPEQAISQSCNTAFEATVIEWDASSQQLLMSYFQDITREPFKNVEDLKNNRLFFYFAPELVSIETEIYTLTKLLETTGEKNIEPSGKASLESNNNGVLLNSSVKLGVHNENAILSPIKTLSNMLTNKKINERNERGSLSTKIDRCHSKPENMTLRQNSTNSAPSCSIKEQKIEERQLTKPRYDQQEKNGNGKRDNQQNKKNRKEQENKKLGKVQLLSRSCSVNMPCNQTFTSRTETNAASIDNIFIRFMALMARILGQAELEAHSLYLRVKERTDNIDLLTLLLSKINSEKGAIDWSKNQEMKDLIDKARALGVDIPNNKYQWSENDKKMLKENIQMRKDSMEKITQLERTDMQRYLQEASQCHQARSNVLKLLKEVNDTIIHNMRPS